MLINLKNDYMIKYMDLYKEKGGQTFA